MIIRIRNWRELMLSWVLVCISVAIYGQNSDDAREVTTTYYIKNANVVQSPTRTIPNASILIEDGMIKDVGTNVTIPFDAKVIDADSMYVYAGFIDACSHAGLSKPEDKGNPTVPNPGNPPKDLAGITPQHSVRSLWGDKADKSLHDLRDLGFGYVHVVPHGRMLPGHGSVVTTGDGSIEDLLLRENVSTFAQFRGARRMFPATTIGVMSQFRDLIKNASYTNQHSKAYAASPLGMERPVRSEELAALIPVVEKKQSVFFMTPKVKDVNRALILQEELGFQLVLTGVQQGWPLMSSIKASGNPVVLSLDLPKEIKDEENDDEDDDDDENDNKDEEEDGDENEDGKKKKEDDPELQLLKAKKKESHDQYVGQAGAFERENIKFSFSTVNAKAKDIKSNILRMVKGGLSEQGALAALTTNPASLLGISAMAGTVEKGKIANIFVMDKPYFDEKSKVKYMMSDGVLIEKKEEKKKKKSDGSGGSLEGVWSYSVEIPGDTQRGQIKIDGKGDDIQVSVSSSDAPDDFDKATNVVVSDGNLSFDISVEGMNYSISLDRDGDDLEGSVTAGEFGTFPMKASKTPE